MAPLTQALHVQYGSTIKLRGDTVYVYKGSIDGEWTMISVPHGGYVLGLVIESIVQQQSTAVHPDPIHVTAHFLRATTIAPFEVHVRILKTGKGFSHLTAELMQNNHATIKTHFICGVLSPPNEELSGPSLTLEPPSPLAHRIPMFTHPSKCPITPFWQKQGCGQYWRKADDPVHDTNLQTAKKGMEHGTYLTLVDPEERITTSSLAFFADMFKSLPEVAPEVLKNYPRGRWQPTMTMTMEFKFPIPPPSDINHASRTVAIFSSGKFINDPQGRHDTYVEVWTAPSNIGEGEEQPGWRERQRCLVVASQMALIVPAAVNRKVAQGKSKL